MFFGNTLEIHDFTNKVNHTVLFCSAQWLVKELQESLQWKSLINNHASVMIRFNRMGYSYRRYLYLVVGERMSKCLQRILTYNHLDRKQTLNHSAKLALNLKIRNLKWNLKSVKFQLKCLFWAESYLTADVFLFKVNNRNIRKRCEIYSKLTIKHKNDVTGVLLVFLLLTLNIFHVFFWCFYCWLWRGKC